MSWHLEVLITGLRDADTNPKGYLH